jgi:BTB And C-terminal Kelch
MSQRIYSSSGFVQMVKKKVGPDNLSQYVYFAEQFNLTALTQLCHTFLIDNFCKCVRESDFLFLPYDALRVALQSDSLTITSEYEIYEVGNNASALLQVSAALDEGVFCL